MVAKFSRIGSISWMWIAAGAAAVTVTAAGFVIATNPAIREQFERLLAKPVVTTQVTQSMGDTAVPVDATASDASTSAPSETPIAEGQGDFSLSAVIEGVTNLLGISPAVELSP